MKLPGAIHIGVLFLILVLLGAAPVHVADAQSAERQSAQVVVSGSVQATRLIVVSPDGQIIQIWSNSDRPIELTARRDLRTGAVAELTPAIRAQYEVIAPTIPAEARGLVYRR